MANTLSTASLFNGVVGASGSVLTTTGSNGTYSASWIPQSTNFVSSNQKSIMTIPHGEEKIVLEEQAALEVKGKLVINGINVEERLNAIERVLGIPERDAIMEAKYPSLKKKFDEYINTLEKYRTFERIKGDYE